MKISILAAAIAAGTLLLAGCQENTSTPKQSPIQRITTDNSYAARGADQSWPGAPLDSVELAASAMTKNYYLVFDGSGSMDDSACDEPSKKVYSAIDAVTQFVDGMTTDVNVGLVIFDRSGVREAYPLSPINKEALKQHVKGVLASGGTPLAETINLGYQRLTQQAQKQQGYGEYNLVVITDGAANDEGAMNQVVGNVVSSSAVNIHTIGFCIGNDHALNQPGVINYQSANNAKELVTGLKSVLAESESFQLGSFEGS